MSDNCFLSLGLCQPLCVSLLTVKVNTASGLLKRGGQRERGVGLHKWTTTPGGNERTENGGGVWGGGGRERGASSHALNTKHNNASRADVQVNNVTSQETMKVRCLITLLHCVVFSVRTKTIHFLSDLSSLSERLRHCFKR